MTRPAALGAALVAVLALAPWASARVRWAADSPRGNQAITVPCPDGTKATVTLQAAQLEYVKARPVPLQLAQHVRVGVVGTAPACATEMRFEVISPPKVENSAPTEVARCMLGGGDKGACFPGWDEKGPHGGYYLNQLDYNPFDEDVEETDTAPPAHWFAVPQVAASQPFRLQIPMIPNVVYKTFGKREVLCNRGPCRPAKAAGRAQVVVYVRPTGTTGPGVTAFTSVGLWTAGGSPATYASPPKTVSRAALAAGRVRIAAEGPEAYPVTVKVHAGRKLVASGRGVLPEDGKLKVRLRVRGRIPTSTRSVTIDVLIGASGLQSRARLTT